MIKKNRRVVFCCCLALAMPAAKGGNGDALTNIVHKISCKNYAEAVSELDPLVAKMEQALDRLYKMRAESYFGMGEFKKAEADYRKTLGNSRNGIAEYAVGKCLLEQAKYHEANAFFVRALEHLPETGSAHTRFQYKYHIALTLFEMKQREEAIRQFHALHEEYPGEDMAAIMRFIETYRIREKLQSDED